MQLFKIGEYIGKRNDDLLKLLNEHETTEEMLLKNLTDNPAPVDITAHLLGPKGDKMGEGKDICFGLLTDIYEAGEVGYLCGYDDQGEETYMIEVWYINDAEVRE